MTKPFSPRRKAEKHHWTAAELDTLRLRYPDTKTSVLSEDMGLPINAIHHCAAKHGIRKDKTHIADVSRENTNGQATRFKPGHSTWNKGKPFISGGRSAETQFKKGQSVHNHRPVGSTRINVDGYIEIKIAEPRTWGQLHRENWKAANGDYPAKNMAIVFKDRNPRNCDISNLELITRGDLMLRNSCHAHGPEVAQLIQLRGAISRQINKRAKQDKEAA